MARTGIMVKNMHHKELNIVECGSESCTPNHSFGPIARNYWLLHYVTKGSGVFCTKGREYALGVGDIFVIKPQEVTYYKASEDDPWEYIWIGFTAEIPLPEQLKKDTFRIFYAQSLFKSMLKCDEMSYGREAYLCGCLWQLFARMYEQASRQDAGDAVRMAVSFIETEFANSLSVAELADRLHLNRSYFSTLFKQTIGMSPHQYLSSVRLAKAAELMSVYGLSPGRVATTCGYADIYAFSRMFKRHYGRSPNEYIKERRK